MSSEVLWSLLPLAVVIALSPIHLIPAVMVVFSPRAVASSAGFVGAWVGGLLLVTSVAAALAMVAGIRGEVVGIGGGEWQATVKVILGVLLVLAGLRRWLTRSGSHGARPRWVLSLDSVTPAGAAKVGLLLSLANPKVVLMAGAAGVAIGSAVVAGVSELGDGSVALFVAVATATVVLPLLGYLVWGQQFRVPLARVRDQLIGNHAAAMAVMMGGLGVVLLLEGMLAL